MFEFQNSRFARPAPARKFHNSVLQEQSCASFRCGLVRHLILAAVAGLLPLHRVAAQLPSGSVSYEPVLGELFAEASAMSPDVTDGGVHTITATAQNHPGGGAHTIQINVYAPPRIVSHPASQTIFVGDSTSFTVTANSTPVPPNTVELGSPPFSMNAVSETAAINPLAYAISPAGVATVSLTGIVTTTNAGSATVTVSQPGNENYDPAVPVIHALVVTSSKIVPVIEWPAPADIVVGTALGAAQLNAVAKHDGAVVDGSYVYSPEAGTELPVGTHRLSVAFVPADPSRDESASAATSINVVASPDECGPAIVHHAITMNGNAAIDGSIQMLLPEDMAMNDHAWISEDLLMPGSPKLQLNGKSVIGSVVDGTGAAAPDSHTLTPNGTVTLDGKDTLRGGLISDRLVINGNGLVELCDCP